MNEKDATEWPPWRTDCLTNLKYRTVKNPLLAGGNRDFVRGYDGMSVSEISTGRDVMFCLFVLLFEGRNGKRSPPPTTASGTAACVRSRTAPKRSNA